MRRGNLWGKAGLDYSFLLFMGGREGDRRADFIEGARGGLLGKYLLPAIYICNPSFLSFFTAWLPCQFPFTVIFKSKQRVSCEEVESSGGSDADGRQISTDVCVLSTRVHWSTPVLLFNSWCLFSGVYCCCTCRVFKIEIFHILNIKYRLIKKLIIEFVTKLRDKFIKTN